MMADYLELLRNYLKVAFKYWAAALVVPELDQGLPRQLTKILMAIRIFRRGVQRQVQIVQIVEI